MNKSCKPGRRLAGFLGMTSRVIVVAFACLALSVSGKTPTADNLGMIRQRLEKHNRGDWRAQLEDVAGRTRTQDPGGSCPSGGQAGGGAGAPGIDESKTPIERAIEALRNFLSGGKSKDLTPSERQKIEEALADLTEGFEAFDDHRIGPEDFDRLSKLLEALKEIFALIESDTISGDLATAFQRLKGLFLVFLEELWDGLREMPVDGGRRFVRTLQSATWMEQGGTIRICVDRLDEPIGLIEFDLLPILAPDLPGILKPFVGVDLEIYRDTHIEIDHSAANEGRFSITFTPGTTKFDFTSLLNIICLPDDIWLTRVAVQDSTIIIDGSLDQDGGRPRRYEIRGGRAYIYLPYLIGTSVHYQLIEVKDLLNCVR